ncbi:hypothetical protein BGW38_005581 [Lunasporangiospora selenospora]|uniref:FAD-binding domain-containing protein n=1 Tax=Lunasporangiospora selenospora TaxID=979761 RepID=A0A9P6G097_9FUNG|nr:hypothetical protein BGW38_005581 [Lunasporangiospora selenospora]
MPSMPPSSPRVMIVGAGIGGLFLAILLQRAGIDFEIFERASTVKPLGSAMVTGPNILPVFEQLGLLERVESISKPLKCLTIRDPELEPLGSVDANSKERAGYHSMVFARRNLHQLLLSQIPPHKLHMGKKVLSMLQNHEGVMVRCSDNSTHRGDILVGADGAYSGVRQSLFKQMKAEGILPRHDAEELSMDYICLVGTTNSLDPEQFPQLKDTFSHFEIVLTKNPTESIPQIACFTVPDNKICWLYTVQLSPTCPDERFRNSEWGPEAASAMCDKVRHVQAPFGLTMGDLIDVTPREVISKVMLEEKLFETWCHGRTVLLGDACHKMLPTAGQGAINAMQDATILANCINDLKSYSARNISAALMEYRNQRYHHAKAQFETSKRFAGIMAGQTWTNVLIRKLVLSYMPKSINVRRQDKTCAYRPQVNFIQQAPYRGSIAVLPQVPSKRTSVNTKIMG